MFESNTPDDCSKARVYASFSTNPNWQATSLTNWGGLSLAGCPPLLSPPPPSSPWWTDHNGAIIELTGDVPTIVFGTLESPVCTLSLDRNNRRVDSTCAITTERRRLADMVSPDDEVSAAKHENYALKTELADVTTELHKVKREMAELRALVSALMSRSDYAQE